MDTCHDAKYGMLGLKYWVKSRLEAKMFCFPRLLPVSHLRVLLCYLSSEPTVTREVEMEIAVTGQIDISMLLALEELVSSKRDLYYVSPAL